MDTARSKEDRGSFTIRDYRPEDFPGVVSVIKSVYNDYNYRMDYNEFDRDLADIESMYIDSGGAFWVLDADGVIAGTIGIIPVDTEMCELRRLYLKAPYRGKGWGTKLVQRVIDWAEEHGFRRIFLWSDVLFEPARHLYMKAGFTPTKRTRAIDPMNPTSVERYFIREE
jgi:putative acetyltransferase